MKKLAERLQYFNEWRRGAKTKMPDTTKIGLDIDSTIIIINQYNKKQDERKLNKQGQALQKEIESISFDDFEEYTCNGEVFSVECASKYFNVSIEAIRAKAHSLGYSHARAECYESL